MKPSRPRVTQTSIAFPDNVLPYPEGVHLPEVYKCRLALLRESTVPALVGEFLGQPHYVASLLWREFFHDLDREAMVAAYLDVHNRLVAYTVAYVGSLYRATAEPRGLLVPALLCNATGLILAHNHPSSGVTTPSVEDLTFTRKMAKAAELLDLRLVDHIILGEQGTWLSMHERGGW